MTLDRGILYPSHLPTFARIPPAAEFAALVRWFWVSQWDIAPGEVSRQHLIGFPASNYVVEHDRVGISGPTTARSHQDLTGRGWAVAALLRPAAVPAVVGDPTEVLDRYVLLNPSPRVTALHSAVTTLMSPGRPQEQDLDAATTELGRHLRALVGDPGEEGRLANRMADLADSRADLISVEDLAAELGVSVRTTQRLARRYVGVSPRAMIARRRLQEAAERIRLDPGTDLAALAHDLGYSDHAHLTGDFRRVLGFTPTTYRNDTAAGRGSEQPTAPSTAQVTAP